MVAVGLHFHLSHRHQLNSGLTFAPPHPSPSDPVTYPSDGPTGSGETTPTILCGARTEERVDTEDELRKEGVGRAWNEEEVHGPM